MAGSFRRSLTSGRGRRAGEAPSLRLSPSLLEAWWVDGQATCGSRPRSTPRGRGPPPASRQRRRRSLAPRLRRAEPGELEHDRSTVHLPAPAGRLCGRQRGDALALPSTAAAPNPDDLGLVAASRRAGAPGTAAGHRQPFPQSMMTWRELAVGLVMDPGGSTPRLPVRPRTRSFVPGPLPYPSSPNGSTRRPTLRGDGRRRRRSHRGCARPGLRPSRHFPARCSTLPHTRSSCPTTCRSCRRAPSRAGGEPRSGRARRGLLQARGAAAAA